MFPEDDKFTALYQTMRYPHKKRHYVYQTLQTTKSSFEKLFWKTTIVIRFNLLVCLSMRPFVFAVFSYLVLVFWSFILCFTYFAGSSLPVSCHSSCKPVFNLVFAPHPLQKQWSFKGGFFFPHSHLAKRFCAHNVEANNHLTLASLPINFCYTFVEPFCRDTRIKCRSISTRNWPSLAWENNRHFATPLLVSPRSDVWETSAEIPYWWRVTTRSG